jgi:hypothetical protein
LAEIFGREFDGSCFDIFFEARQLQLSLRFIF